MFVFVLALTNALGMSYPISVLSNNEVHKYECQGYY